MKKIAIITGVILLTAGSVLYGVNSGTKTETPCPNTENCVCKPTPCACTPDCQPGDPNCTCPMDCEK